MNRSKLLDELDDGNGVLLITDAKGHILYADKQVEESKGFSLCEMLGRRPGELWGGHMDEAFYKKLWDYIYVQKRPFVADMENLSKDGHELHEHVHIAPLLNLEGEIEYFIEVDPKLRSIRDWSAFDKEFLSLNNSHLFTPDDLMGFLSRWLLDIDNPHLMHAQGIDFPQFMHKLFLSQNENSKIEDKYLVESAQANKKNFKKLYDKYYGKIIRYFLHRVNRPEEAEELCQETFVRAFASLNYFNYQNCTYLSYLLMIAHNLLVNYYRKQRPVLIEDFQYIASSDETDLYKEIELELLWKAVHDLSETEEKILKMKYQEDMSIRQIATDLNKSENAVKLILSRARKKLRDKLST